MVKYELPIPAQLSGKVKGQRPSFIPKTDEERVQNLSHLVEKYQDEEFYVTEKLDGSSATFYKLNGEFGVCSRNLELLETKENSLTSNKMLLKDIECIYWNPDCKICVKKEIKRVASLMSRAGKCNKCIEPLVGSKHCLGLEMGCACECKK